mmetsp:Transcript_22788/g.35696  ORF Transcript_22788/g.35696 Transcript_22788/m.35696 type:complete len:152 (+) Transcript_22788:148-603(+)|eukprot:CAMPEP_0184304098 /NCGR_PEP_ID=MMETSP1049-20130417/13715_1 /TAXON_ID=77928 /ORGANISM="Proteomonas sulcata, Strain CCMP704" /LENGTH=151 /DNA_ID=CAMNT_0026615837 /DNA_START=115 /DNA_END=570 /DNA_ORIENTATION=-
MGNLFSSAAEKEWKKLTKKNTKANRDAVASPAPDEDPYMIPADDSLKMTRQVSSPGSIRFGNLVTEVRYDHEEGEIDVAEENLCLALDDDPHDATPTPVVDARQQQPSSPNEMKRANSGILRRGGSERSFNQSNGSNSPVARDGMPLSDRT